MARHKIAYIAGTDTDVALIEQGLGGLDYEMSIDICSSPGEAIEAIRGADVIIDVGVKMSRQVIEQIDTAKAIVNIGHGFDGIDHVAATDHGVMVVNTAGFVTEEVANHTIMMLLACARKLTILRDLVRAGRWGPDTDAQYPGMPQIYGQVLGLVGLGNIARATAVRAKTFGLEVIAYDPYMPPWIAKESRVELVPTLEEVAARSDFVSVLVPLNDETRKLIGAPFFKAMKPTAYFINTCRGPTVDEGALIAALQAAEIAGAGLDVFEEEPTPSDNPLLKMDNVIVTPHSAGQSQLAVPAAKLRLGEEAARVLSGTWPMSLVNPEVRASIPSRPAALNA